MATKRQNNPHIHGHENSGQSTYTWPIHILWPREGRTIHIYMPTRRRNNTHTRPREGRTIHIYMATRRRKNTHTRPREGRTIHIYMATRRQNNPHIRGHEKVCQSIHTSPENTQQSTAKRWQNNPQKYRLRHGKTIHTNIVRRKQNHTCMA